MSGRAAAPGGIEVVTFGCRLNIVESEAMRAAAQRAGHDDLVVVNTCAVTTEASRQSRQAVRRARRDRPDAEIVVTGCAAEIEPRLFSAMPDVDRLIANARKTSPQAWDWRTGNGLAPAQGTDGPVSWAAPSGRHTRGFVEIQNGCNHRCTFCVIPFGRGNSRCVAPSDIVAAVRRAVEAGAGEVVLTGVDVTSYAARDAATLGALVKLVLREVPELPRLRLSSIDCIEVEGDFLAVLATEPRLMPHLHLSLQSGSDLILKRMKRRHSRAEALAFCRKARSLRPDIAFGADVIAGFPTETEDDLAQTEALLDVCGIAYLHVFPYSTRPGTPAARMPQISAEVVKQRAGRLRRAGEASLRRHLDGHVGRTRTVLTERGGRARTEDFSSVRIEGAESGRLIEVDITGRNGQDLIGVASPSPRFSQSASSTRP